MGGLLRLPPGNRVLWLVSRPGLFVPLRVLGARSPLALSLSPSVAAGHPFRTFLRSFGRSLAALLCAPTPRAFSPFVVPGLVLSQPGGSARGGCAAPGASRCRAPSRPPAPGGHYSSAGDCQGFGRRLPGIAALDNSPFRCCWLIIGRGGVMRLCEFNRSWR